MKTPLLSIITLSLLASCGKVLSPDELLNPTKGLAKDERVDTLEDRVSALEKRLDQAYTSLDSLSQSINDVSIDQDTLEQSIALNTSRIVDLELALEGNGATITSIIDPCGDNPGQYDEVLIQLSSGEIIAYFEQGNKRYLSSLPNGSYRTTDKQSCRFDVVGGEYVPVD